MPVAAVPRWTSAAARAHSPAHLAELGYRAVGVDWSKVDVHELDPSFHCYRPRP
ncbi:hypothetical protein ACIQ8D_36310 [Streptomyces sp. NPDC096094]|uniref:hypothetical protein n=1 Tax=Streptomyces sp. NPDC096094 TaxID=3366073 RepID=UPI003814AE4C